MGFGLPEMQLLWWCSKVREGSRFTSASTVCKVNIWHCWKSDRKWTDEILNIEMVIDQGDQQRGSLSRASLSQGGRCFRTYRNRQGPKRMQVYLNGHVRMPKGFYFALLLTAGHDEPVLTSFAHPSPRFVSMYWYCAENNIINIYTTELNQSIVRYHFFPFQLCFYWNELWSRFDEVR